MQAPAFSFQYKREESMLSEPSSAHHEKNSHLMVWFCILFVLFFGLFFAGYRQSSVSKVFEQQQKTRDLQSLMEVSAEPFLVRVQTSSGFELAKVRVQFFVGNSQVQNELREEQAQFKEHLLFFLSHTHSEDFLQDHRRQALQEKIKNHINSFLSHGKIQEIIISSQFIEQGGPHG